MRVVHEFFGYSKNSGQILVTFSGSVDEEDFISFLWNDADCSPGLGHRLILICRLSLPLLELCALPCALLVHDAAVYTES